MFLIPHIEVRTTGEKGRGVFATAEIPAGTVIGDYLGTVLRPDETLLEDAIYEVWYSDLAVLSPDTSVNDMYLLNHSCEANCGLADKERHTLVSALRTIFPGEELSYTYMIGPKTDDAADRRCYCGSSHCKGTLYNDPLHYAAWETWMESIQSTLPEEPPVPYGEMLPPLSAYPGTLPDLEIYSLYGSRTHSPLFLHSPTLPSALEIRNIIRETGRMIDFPACHCRVEGVLFSGQLITVPVVWQSQEVQEILAAPSPIS